MTVTLCLTLAAGHANETDKPIVALDASDTLRDTLLTALAAKGDGYEPRTEHLFDDGSPMYTNRLILEDSPYLIQHAHNPVNWYPWGEEAFAAAKEQNKPIFLSIGYATCHWCHVMERESFENFTVAHNLNENYIAIKVDREQLPDVDALYMTAVMMIAGNGGWPMSNWLDSEGRPFFGGTYYPTDQFHQLLNRINELWTSDRQTLLDQAVQVSSAIKRTNETKATARKVGTGEISRALNQALGMFDAENGGFGGAPKFPRESTLFFLLDEAERNQDPEVLKAATVTLDKMAAGGIHDHVAGGFHRYAVDSRWLVPHFEKMLYNQAALARNYAHAWSLTADHSHARTATRILDYVIREMRTDDGLFYSATDADSEGEEGLFFVWTPEELDEVLGESDAEKAKRVWNVTGDGNFEGHSILFISSDLSELAKSFDTTEKQLVEMMDQWTATLLEARQLREKPILDDKVITSWNAMMLTALVEGSERLGNPEYLSAAEEGAQALWDTMMSSNGDLKRTFFNGRSSIEGTQLDYAYFTESLIALFDATADSAWLDRAVTLNDEMHNRFWDAASGGYFMGAASVGGTELAVRPKDIHDNSIPAGNSVALRALGKLYKRTGEPRFETRADELITVLSERIDQSPAGFYYFLLGANEHLQGEIGATQYAARGRVKATVELENNELIARVQLAPGWHINSNTPIQDYLIPTQLQLQDSSPMADAIYPNPTMHELSFDDSELSLFEGPIEIRAPLPELAGKSLEVNLQLQACNDTHCLPPETVPLTLSATSLAERTL